MQCRFITRRIAASAVLSLSLAPLLIACPPSEDSPPAAVSREGRHAIPRVPRSYARIVATRIPSESGDVTLAFRDAPAADVFAFIAARTGKVLCVRSIQFKPYVITLTGTRPVESSTALDHVYEALAMNNILVSEDETSVRVSFIGDGESATAGSALVLGVDDDVRAIPGDGLAVRKVFQLRHADAESVAGALIQMLPDWARLVSDAASNQIIVRGTTGVAKTVQAMIDQLDRPLPETQRDDQKPSPRATATLTPQMLDPQSISRMDHMTALQALGVVAKAREHAVSDLKNEQLQAAFNLLMARIRELNPESSK